MIPTPAPLRVVVLSEDPLARSGLVALLERRDEIRVVGTGGLQDGLARQTGAGNADSLLVDLAWDTAAGLAALESLLEAGLPVVCLVADDETASAAWVAGARAILPRDVDAARLTAALKAFTSGWVVLDPELDLQALRAGHPLAASTDEPLTPRELEVLVLLAEGLSNKGIAARLEVSEHTAKFHVNAILRKLGAQSRTEAVVTATRRGLILL